MIGSSPALGEDDLAKMAKEAGMGKGQRTSIGKETPRRKRSKASRTRHAADATLGVASSGAAKTEL